MSINATAISAAWRKLLVPSSPFPTSLPIPNHFLSSTDAQTTATDKDEVPTHRAVTERLVKIRAMAKANGAGHFAVSKGSAKGEAKGGPNPRTPTATPRKPRVKKDSATPGNNGTGAKRGRSRPAAAAIVKKEATTSDDDNEEVNTKPTKNTANCSVPIRKHVTSSAEEDTNGMATPTHKARGSSNTEEDSDTMASPSKKVKTNGTPKGKVMRAKALTPVRTEEDSDTTMVSPSKKAKTNGIPKGKVAFTKALTPVRASTPDEEELDEDTIRVGSNLAFSFDGATDEKVEESGSEYEDGY